MTTTIRTSCRAVTVQTIDIKALHAISAAENMNNWGSFAASLYAKNRGVSARLLVIAMRCAAKDKKDREAMDALAARTDAAEKLAAMQARQQEAEEMLSALAGRKIGLYD
jgi:hypothetical protein